jgi:hypothetical protein
MRKNVFAVAAILAACGGQQGGGATSPVASPSEALTQFMRAAADSNLARMSELWGSSSGPSAQTRSPENFERRLVVIQAYLRADSSRIASNVSTDSDNRRQLVVQIYREGCMKQIPATMTRVKGGWIVTNIDLTPAGNPARPCEPPESDDGITR